QLLTESTVLALAGGALGGGLIVATQSALSRFAASAVPLFADVRVDRSVLLFALGLTLAAPILFGILPALTAPAMGGVNERAAAGSREARVLRTSLVGAEVALAIVLVTGALLLVRSLARLQTVDPGFDDDHAVSFRIALPAARYADAAASANGLS